MNKKYLIIIAIIIILAIIGFALFSNSNTQKGSNIDVNALESKGNLEIDGQSQELANALYSTDKSDVNSILVKNGGILKLTGSFINKTGDTATSGDDADFYGVNSAVLVKDSAQATIENCEINTNSKGSNAIFVTNTNSDSSQGGGPNEGGTSPEQDSKTDTGSNTTVANIKNVKITTYQDKSRGLDATFGGIINAENIEINTNGGSCAALATDRGEGTVSVKNSILNTGVDDNKGHGSPLIYSTGNITVEDTTGTAHDGQIACIEGKNSITLKNCNLDCSAEGNRKDGDNYVDLGGIFIYQSMSGDADVGTSLFDCEDTTLSVKSDSQYYSASPMFHITNTKANINLKNSVFNFGSGILFDISGQNQWGNQGSNGGNVNLTAQGMSLNGDIIVDEISSLYFNLKDTTFKGAINSTGTTDIIIESGSTWELTGDSNVTSLQNNGNINLNGHSLYVNGVKYNG